MPTSFNIGKNFTHYLVRWAGAFLLLVTIKWKALYCAVLVVVVADVLRLDLRCCSTSLKRSDVSWLANGTCISIWKSSPPHITIVSVVTNDNAIDMGSPFL